MNSENANGETITEALIANVLNTRFEDIEQEVVDNTKRRILDMIGNALGGSRCDGNPELARLVKGWGGKKEASILGFGSKGPINHVAMVNCIFGRSFDRGPLVLIIDGDGGPGTVYIDGKPIRRYATHITETTALTALALAESKGLDGKGLITALVAGDDLVARLDIANNWLPPGQSSGTTKATPPKTTTPTLGAVAIAGRMLGLNSTQMRNAFGLASFLSGGMGSLLPKSPSAPAKPSGQKDTDAGKGLNPGWQGLKDPFFIAAMARGGWEETVRTKMMNGLQARDGIIAAQLAEAGWPGLKDPFFGKRGGHFPGIESCGHPERITEGLGKKFHVEQVFKPWPGGRPTNTTSEAALTILDKHDINSDDIEEIILHLSPDRTYLHYCKPYSIGEYPTMNALWSYYFSVASTLYRKSSIDENFTEEKIRDPKLQALIKKVKLGDGNRDLSTGVELEVIMKDGRKLSANVSDPIGEPYKPLSREGLIDKFMEQAEFSKLVDKKDAEEAVKLLENLESVDNINKIVELVVKRQ